MAGDRSNLLDGQAHLEEAACGFVPQVVESQIIDLQSITHAAESIRQGMRIADPEDSLPRIFIDVLYYF